MGDRHLPHPAPNLVHEGNLLNAAIRSDISDLNRLFLDCALDPVMALDPWFRLPEAARNRFLHAEPDIRERAASSPIALFELSLPSGDESRGDAVAEGVDADD